MVEKPALMLALFLSIASFSACSELSSEILVLSAMIAHFFSRDNEIEAFSYSISFLSPVCTTAMADKRARRIAGKSSRSRGKTRAAEDS